MKVSDVTAEEVEHRSDKRPHKRKQVDLNETPLTSATTTEDEEEPTYTESGISALESEDVGSSLGHGHGHVSCKFCNIHC